NPPHCWSPCRPGLSASSPGSARALVISASASPIAASTASPMRPKVSLDARLCAVCRPSRSREVMFMAGPAYREERSAAIGMSRARASTRASRGHPSGNPAALELELVMRDERRVAEVDQLLEIAAQLAQALLVLRHHQKPIEERLPHVVANAVECIDDVSGEH